jgi:flagellar hook-basal body complex protein FliE
MLSEAPDTPKASGGGAASFSDILTDAMSTASEADLTDKQSTLELLAGQADDFSGLMIDAQKAEISLNLALQLRNKILDAYKEIMNMQV